MSLLNDDRSRSRTKPAVPQALSKSRPSSVPPKPKPPELEGPPKPVAPVLVGWEPEVKQQAPPVSKIVEMNQKRKAAEEQELDRRQEEAKAALLAHPPLARCQSLMWSWRVAVPMIWR
jgi:hypothetical protein